MCVGACNFFSDTTRTNTCTLKDGSLLENEEASAVFDTSLRLVTIWHIAEWVRSTVMLCITMLGAPFLSIWYATGIVTSLFGLVSFLLVHVGRFGEEGISCAESQSTPRLVDDLGGHFLLALLRLLPVPHDCFPLLQEREALRDHWGERRWRRGVISKRHAEHKNLFALFVAALCREICNWNG